MRKVCRKFNQKCGQYTRAKKPLSAWSQQICRSYASINCRYLVFELTSFQFPYHLFDKSMIFSLFEPFKYIEIIGVFQCWERQYYWRSKRKGIAILIYRKTMNKSYDELLKIFKDSLTKCIGSEHDITTELWIAPESIDTDKYDANQFLNYVTKSEMYDLRYNYRLFFFFIL